MAKSIMFFVFSLVFFLLLGIYSFWQISLHREGNVTEYFRNGQVRSEATFKKGYPHGMVTVYYENGNFKKKIEFKDGKQHGKTTTFYESGGLRSEEHYASNILHGPAVFYEKNGDLQWEVVFKRGMKIDSTFKVYRKLKP